MSENFDEATTVEEKGAFYDLIQKIKEQYLSIRDYLEKEVQKTIDAMLENDNIRNFYYAIECCKYLSEGTRGFDLFVSEDGVNFDVITRDGMGDPYNHGCRVFAITDSGLCVGTANPFFGTQVWLLDENEPMFKADVNFDGDIDIFDVTEIQRYIAGYRDFNEDEMYVADVNEDGEVNIFDATMIQRFLAGYIESI